MRPASHAVEITLTVPGAIQIIADVATKYGEKLLVGAGTVLDAETCRLAILAGAEFIVSPAFDARVTRGGPDLRKDLHARRSDAD